MTSTQAIDLRERHVIDCAIQFARARREFSEIRTSGRHTGMTIAAARARRDRAIDTLVAAVEELDR